MAIRKTSIPTKMHILSVGARLMLEQGYRNTTIRAIADEAGVGVSSVQNFFHSKDGLLTELVQLMFSGQFTTARYIAHDALPPVYTYAAETALQLALTERNESLREIYVEAYSIPSTLEFIHLHTTKELMSIFGDQFPDWEESDFYETDVGTAALMRGYMAKPCSVHFPLSRKIDRFLTASLRIYRVEDEQLRQILHFVHNLDLNALAQTALDRLPEYLQSSLAGTLHIP